MVAYGSCNPLFDGIFGRFGLPGAPRASHRTIRLSLRAELLPALAFADVLDHGGRRHRRKRATAGGSSAFARRARIPTLRVRSTVRPVPNRQLATASVKSALRSGVPFW